jgi:hypothetical protein
LSAKTTQEAEDQKGEKLYGLSLAENYEVDWIKKGVMGWACGAQESKRKYIKPLGRINIIIK